MHYGFPPHGGAGVKIAKHHHRDETVDPDRHDRTVRADDEALIRNALAEHIPAANGRMLAAKTCLYTMTPDGDFIIDRLPGQHRGRLALLRPRLQVRAGDRRNPRRPGDERRDAPRYCAFPPGAVRVGLRRPPKSIAALRNC